MVGAQRDAEIASMLFFIDTIAASSLVIHRAQAKITLQSHSAGGCLVWYHHSLKTNGLKFSCLGRRDWTTKERPLGGSGR